MLATAFDRGAEEATTLLGDAVGKGAVPEPIAKKNKETKNRAESQSAA